MNDMGRRPGADHLPDHAAERDDRALAIDRVGVHDLTYPIQVLDKQRGLQHTVARLGLYVGLPSDVKGTHMSRFIEVLNAVRGEVTIRNMPAILRQIQRRLEADEAYLEATFPYFITKRAPVSGAESLMEYECGFEARAHGPVVDFILTVKVPVKSLCPCSKAVSEYGAHNQRSLITVSMSSEDFVWIEDVVDAVERCASSPLYALLKREDEKYVTEKAYENPRFVEDLARDVVLSLRAIDGLRWLKISVDNQESIHNHSAYAEIEWHARKPSAREEVARASGAPTPPPLGPDEAQDFGTWLKATRRGRRLTQQQLADRLGVSASFVCRVESGEKSLSPELLDRLADALGQDVTQVHVRAGHVPDALMAQITRQPERFLALMRQLS